MTKRERERENRGETDTSKKIGSNHLCSQNAGVSL
jgi:hypothetical protein